MRARPAIAILLRRRESGIFLALVGLVALMSALRPEFATSYNLFMVSRQIAFVAIVAIAVFFVILTSGIDLSVGSIVGMSGIAAGIAMASGLHPAAAVLVGLTCGALAGAVNGFIVSYVGVTPFIVTLGMMSVARGAIMVRTHGDSVRSIPEGFISAGNSNVLGLPVPVIMLIVIAVGSHVLLTRTPFGRWIFALGANEMATKLSGINTRFVKFMAYVICGLLCSVTGVMLISRFRSAQANSGFGWELDAIAAAVIGGTSLMGGQGTIPGVLIGATIMGVIRNGLVLMEVSSYWQELIIGAIIVLAAILDMVRSRRSTAS